MHEAMLYEKGEDGSVRCGLCAHRCRIRPGQRGICAVRENRDGTLYSLVYAQVVSQAIDPIEKKPLYHFLPGSTSYSIATLGCNLQCEWCQNWQISQAPRLAEVEPSREVPPEHIVAAAKRFGCASISYTYTEPTIYFEYAYDVAKMAAQHGLANVFVTNGYMTEECLELLGPVNGGAPLLSAANVDLKGWSDDLYRRHAGGRLEPVLNSLRLMKHLGIWVEVTTLIVPGLNDDEEGLRGIAHFIKEDLGADTPWHVTRFHPDFRMAGTSATATATLRQAREIGLDAGLHFVYEGNIPGTDGENTVCPNCHRTVISRYGFRVVANRLADGACPDCGTPLAGVWSAPSSE